MSTRVREDLSGGPSSNSHEASSRGPDNRKGRGGSAIKLRDVRVVYGRGKRDAGVVALDNTSLEVGDHEFVSLLGPSGCGKTTLLKVVGGLLQPVAGEVTIRGGTVRDALKRRAFGMVFQSPTLLPWRKVAENARLLGEIIGDPETPARAEKLLEAVGLAGFEKRYPNELSGGMQQRVGIVRALAIDPDILLMDEPFAAVDALTRDRLGGMLLDIWNQARPVVFVTHSIEEAVFLSDRVIVMTARPGRVLTEVPIDLPRPREQAVRDTAEFAALRGQLRQAVDKAQAGEEG